MEKRVSHSAKMILIVEDHPGTGAFLVDLIKAATPYYALLVTNEFQAVEVVKTVRPDLFLLDCHPPQMDGLELYDHLQAIEEIKQIPALLMSSNAHGQDWEHRRIAFLRKPFTSKEVLQALGKLLEEL